MSGIPAYILGDEHVEINKDRRTIKVVVRNCGDRPIQVGSHFHFFEVNRQLRFDRVQSFGMRLDIPAGTAVRFEPGDEKEVVLVAFGGQRQIVGFSGLVEGPLDGQNVLDEAMERAKAQGFQESSGQEVT